MSNAAKIAVCLAIATMLALCAIPQSNNENGNNGQTAVCSPSDIQEDKEYGKG